MWSSLSGARTFIPGSHISNSHTDLKNAPTCREGNNNSKVCRHSHCGVQWGETRLDLYSLSLTPSWIFYSLTQGDLPACWGILRTEMNGSLSLCSNMGVHILCLFLSAAGPLEEQKHTPGTAQQTGRGVRTKSPAALWNVGLEKGVCSKAVPVRGLKKHQESRTKAKITSLQWSSRAYLKLHAWVGSHIYISRREMWALLIKTMGFLQSLTSTL